MPEEVSSQGTYVYGVLPAHCPADCRISFQKGAITSSDNANSGATAVGWRHALLIKARALFHMRSTRRRSGDITAYQSQHGPRVKARLLLKPKHRAEGVRLACQSTVNQMPRIRPCDPSILTSILFLPSTTPSPSFAVNSSTGFSPCFFVCLCIRAAVEQSAKWLLILCDVVAISRGHPYQTIRRTLALRLPTPYISSSLSTCLYLHSGN